MMKKHLGSFISLKVLKENYRSIIDEYKIDTLHIHLPYYIDDQNPYYADKTLIPKSITYDEYKENVKFVRELKDYGFKIFIAYPVFVSHEGVNERSELLARTLFGKVYSFRVCPTNKKIIERIIGDIRTIIDIYDIDGIILDYIRFESPMAGFENFFMCFCDNCLKEMERKGFNSKRIVSDVSKFIDLLHMEDFVKSFINNKGLAVGDILEIYDNYPGLFEWFRFKKEHIEEIVKMLTRIMKNDGGRNFIVGANLLSPWWSLIAGQSYSSFSRIVDIIEPMLYADWMQWEGLTAVKEFSSISGLSRDLLTNFYFVILGLAYFSGLKSFDEVRLSSLGVESINYSMNKINIWNVGGAKIWPVLMVNPLDFIHKFLNERLSNKSTMNKEFLLESIRILKENNADGLVFFMFDRGDKEALKEAAKVWFE
ncbi:MAG: hypothetical protein J7K23_06330 [Thermoproteales archaeon]|nr:hypothetical protein [Thermoproteales archaeon]